MSKALNEVDIPPDLTALTVAAIHGLLAGDKSPKPTPGGGMSCEQIGQSAALIAISAYKLLVKHTEETAAK